MRRFIKILFLNMIIITAFLTSTVYATNNAGWAEKTLSKFKINPNKNVYQVIVVGGDPEGVSAAVSAARAGAKVLLLSYEDGLGGLITYGWLNSLDMNHAADGTLVTQGIFKEFYSMIGGDSVDVEIAKQLFSKLIKDEKNITYINNIELKQTIMLGNTIKGLKVSRNGEEVNLYADRIIDATQDGDVATMAGVPYVYGQQDIDLDEAMCVTLIFKVSNVNWTELRQEITKRKQEGQTAEGSNSVSAWGFGDIAKEYIPINQNMRLRGLNMGKQNDGTVLINALQIIGVDGTNKQQTKQAIENGTIEAKNIVEFLKNNISGFENSKFEEVAPELYVRETRHIEGEYTLKAVDALENRDFSDKIAIGSYPMDVQTTLTTNFGFVVGNPDKYGIPFRCIIPKKVDNLFVVGRSASYSSLAASSSRVIPVGMCTAEAAGIASVYSIINNISPRSISKNQKMISEIQTLLKKQGAYLPDFKSPTVNESNWAYEDVRKLTSLRLILNGYVRKGVDLSQEVSKHSFINLCYGYLNRINPSKYNETNYPILNEYKNTEIITSDEVAKIAIYLINSQIVQTTETYELAKTNGLLTNEFINKAISGEKITLDEACNMAVKIIETAMGKQIEY